MVKGVVLQCFEDGNLGSMPDHLGLFLEASLELLLWT